MAEMAKADGQGPGDALDQQNAWSKLRYATLWGAKPRGRNPPPFLFFFFFLTRVQPPTRKSVDAGHFSLADAGIRAKKPSALGPEGRWRYRACAWLVFLPLISSEAERKGTEKSTGVVRL